MYQMANEIRNVIIIGSGPAGLTAALYLSRANLAPLLFAGSKWGGQLMLTTDVENYPGFPKGILGPDLMKLFRDQAERFGTEIIDDDVVSVNLSESPYVVKTPKLDFKAKVVILATGSATRWLGVAGEEKLRGRGVSSCAPCDAPFFKEKKVVVIGGGDSAMEEALVLTKYAQSVTMIHRRESFRASQAMQQKVLANKKINVIWNTDVTEFVGDNKLEKIKLRDNNGKVSEFETDGAFVAIGHTPSTAIFKGQVDLDEKGYIKKHDDHEFKTATNKPGVFVAGDVHDYHYRQAITAAGFGCMAGMDALKYLDKAAPAW